MRLALLIAAALLAAFPARAQVIVDDGNLDSEDPPVTRNAEPYPPQPLYPLPYRKYDWDRPEPGKGAYFADDYHGPSRSQQGERKLKAGSRIYRGRDGLYYCRRIDGTTRPLNALAQALLGNALEPGGTAKLGSVARPTLAHVTRQGAVRCGGGTEILARYDDTGETEVEFLRE